MLFPSLLLPVLGFCNFTLILQYCRTMTDLLKFCDSADLLSERVLTPIAAAPPAASRLALLGLKNQIVESARGWLNTPFRHQGRTKNVGVDCLGLLVGVATELNLKSKTGEPLTALDELGYGHFPDCDYLQNKLAEAMQVIEKPIIGSIGLFNIDGRAQHLGIFGEGTLIHAYAPMRKVVEHGFTDEWEARLVKVYGCLTEQV